MLDRIVHTYQSCTVNKHVPLWRIKNSSNTVVISLLFFERNAQLSVRCASILSSDFFSAQYLESSASETHVITGIQKLSPVDAAVVSPKRKIHQTASGDAMWWSFTNPDIQVSCYCYWTPNYLLRGRWCRQSGAARCPLRSSWCPGRDSGRAECFPPWDCGLLRWALR